MTISGPNRQLSYAVRIGTVARNCGDLLIVLAALHAVPMIVALLADGWKASGWYALPVAVLAVVGLLLHRARPGKEIQHNEAMLVTAATFLAGAVAMSLPFMHVGLDVPDALFESVSGVTTTGLTTLGSVSDKPVSFLFARAWQQWYGGLGIVVLSLALMMGPASAARRLASSEDSARDLAVDTRTHARRMLIVYGALTIAVIVALLLVRLRPLAAVTYGLTAVSTGGFSIDDASLGGVGGLAPRIIVLVAALLGAGSFALYYRWARGLKGGAPWSEASHLGVLVGAALVSLALTWCLRGLQDRAWSEALGHGFAMGISAQTTTGFSTLNVAELPAVAKGVLILAMFIGGDVGSTAGGIKMFRFLIALKCLQHLLDRSSVTPHTVLPRRLGGHRLPDDLALNALILIGLFGATVFLSWMVFLAYGYPPLDALFDVVSATATVGLSTGVTGPELPGVLKGVLCADMLLGRLEIVALLVLVLPRTWLGKRVKQS